jgi:DNA-binding NarL/FixJ family response regulator
MTDKKTRNWGSRARKKFDKLAKRRLQIKDMHAAGKTMAEVAAQFRISEGRVWQIVRDYVK